MAPISDDDPAGINVEYDPDFLNLEAMLPDTTESMIEGGESLATDWSGMRNGAESILGRSKYLPAAVMLAAALVESRGLPGLRDGLCVISGILQDFWDTFWPRLDPDDPDPTERVNILATLSPPLGSYGDSIAFTSHVLDMPIVQSKRAGKLTLRSIESGPDPEKNEADASVVLPDAEPDDVQAAFQAAEDSLEALEIIKQTTSDQTDGAGITDLAVLTQQIKEIRRTIASFLGEAVEDEDETDDGGASDGGGSGPIRSRADVVAAIDRIITFYDNNEPGSPIPLLLVRLQNMVNMRFPELMEQIFPDAVDGSRLMVQNDQQADFGNNE